MDTPFNDKCIVIRVKQETVSTLRPIYKEDAMKPVKVSQRGL